MNTVNNSAEVKKQYADSGNLSTRISIHDRYSVNKQGFGNWIFSNYRIEPGMKVLELGCGTGDMWKGQGDMAGRCETLVLSDFSEGMVATAKENLGALPNAKYQVIDIQNIPYRDGTFDAVIANMMLYHVPDLKKGLSEVRRVLKKDGVFYCATYGERGIVEYLATLLGRYGVEDKINKVFTLQNGEEILGEFFRTVEKREYIDSLAVTDVDDMVEYIYSLSGMTTLAEVPKAEIRDILLKHMQNGVLSVPKEYGMFLASGEKE